MAWKHLTQGGTNYFVNLDEVAFLYQNNSGSVVVFSAKSDDGRLAISVDQSPQQILSGEEVS